MKLSRYITDIEIDEKKSMLYSTLSRKYVVYDREIQEDVKDFLKNINKGVYSESEIRLFKELLEKELIIQNDTDEWKRLESLENMARDQDKIYKITLYVTNACNFRCTYCQQEHVLKKISDQTCESFLGLIAKKAEQFKKIEIDWFGGEPLLEYNRMCDMLDSANKICNSHDCELIATITTNGYLLNLDRIKVLKQLNVKCMQITLDGNKKTHDERRVLSNGKGTYDEVFSNIVLTASQGIAVTLRINIDEKNVGDISQIIENIPEEYRHLIAISICNIFQNKKEYSTYQLQKSAIEAGYVYLNRKNKYVHCNSCLKNAVVIDTDGTVLLCSNADSSEQSLGIITNEGSIDIKNSDGYCKLRQTTARDNPQCMKCIELPYCIGSCKYVRMKDNTKCIGKNGDGLSLEERALLDYYYDLQKERKQTS